HRPPAGALERGRERDALAVDEVVVPSLAVDPGSRLHRPVGEPAAAAERRRVEPAAARREAGGGELPGAGVDDGVDPRRERVALEGELPVALDEHEQHVLAAERPEEIVAGRLAVAVLRQLGAEAGAIL